MPKLTQERRSSRSDGYRGSGANYLSVEEPSGYGAEGCADRERGREVCGRINEHAQAGLRLMLDAGDSTSISPLEYIVSESKQCDQGAATGSQTSASQPIHSSPLRCTKRRQTSVRQVWSHPMINATSISSAHNPAL
jgi:hypothetical protein